METFVKCNFVFLLEKTIDAMTEILMDLMVNIVLLFMKTKIGFVALYW